MPDSRRKMRLRRWSLTRRLLTGILLPGFHRWAGQRLIESVAAEGRAGLHIWFRDPPDYMTIVDVEKPFQSVEVMVDGDSATLGRSDKTGVRFFETRRVVVDVKVESLMSKAHERLIDCAVEIGPLGTVLEVRAPTRWALAGRRKPLRVTRWRVEQADRRQILLSAVSD